MKVAGFPLSWNYIISHSHCLSRHVAASFLSFNLHSFTFNLQFQTVFGQCIQANPGIIYSPAPVVSSCGNSPPIISNPGPSCGYSGSSGGYGGLGTGQLGIVGDLPIGGSTFVQGNLPVIGLVEFNGALPAGGYVTIVGTTPCECSNYGFGY